MRLLYPKNTIRWPQKTRGRKVLWPAREVLKGREQFGHSEVSGVAAFCTEAKVRKQKSPCSLLHLAAALFALGTQGEAIPPKP